MQGGSASRMSVAMLGDKGDNKMSYGFDTMLRVRARNPRIIYRIGST